MIGLTDNQLKTIMHAARSIPVEKRDTFLQQIAAMLALRGRGRFTDTDVRTWGKIGVMEYFSVHVS